LGSGGAPVGSGSIGWNSGYTPLIVADTGNSRLLAADNVTGAYLASFGSNGTGVDEFGTISGLAEDAGKHLYIADSTLDRIVRIDNLSGKNWTTLGGTGAGALQFSHPGGVAIDAHGRIWVADTANDRIVRFDNMTGLNWTSFGTLGAGVDQFNAPAGIAFDASGRVYVADSGNGRLVRFDDLTGKNWTTFSELLIDPYGYPLTSASAVAVNAKGQIYVATSTGTLERIDDMTGTNGQVSYWSGPITGLSLDKSGTLYVVGAFGTDPVAQVLDAAASGYFASALGLSTLQPGAVLALTSASPTPADAVLSGTAFDFGSTNVGEPTGGQVLSVTNLGADVLDLKSLVIGPDYRLANACGSTLAGGASCALTIAFDPTATGARPGTLSITSNGVHATPTVYLTGAGTRPGIVVLPTALEFSAQRIGTRSGSQVVTLTNPGTGPLTIASIAATAGFSEIGNCPKILEPGTGCTLQVAFTPTAAGTLTGALTIADDALPTGTQQVVHLTGSGSASAPALAVSPESIQFPDQSVSTSSAAELIELTNASSTAIALGKPTASGPFKVIDHCGTSLAAKASCTIGVSFAPTAAGAETGSVSLRAAGQTVAVALSGTAVASGESPVLAISPNPVDFGAQVYADSTTLSVAVTNPSGTAVGIRRVALSSEPGMSLTSNNCPAVLPAGGACALGITFVPFSPVTIYAATLAITENSGAQTPVPVIGTGGPDGGGG
jgi:sugar lactone lactonase YvrE